MGQIKISQLTPKGLPLSATDLMVIAEVIPGGYESKSITGTEILTTARSGLQAELVSGTNIKTINSTSLLGTGDVAVQPTLISGTNIKTINGNSLLGTGDIVVGGSNIYTADGTLTGARTLTLGGVALTIAGTTSSTFFSNGNVGIGTTTDAGFKLDVNGTARVQGNLSLIASKQITWGTANSGGSVNRIYLFDQGSSSTRTGLGMTTSNLMFFSYSGTGFQFVAGGDTSGGGTILATLNSNGNYTMGNTTRITWGSSNNPVNKILLFDGGSSSTRYGLSATTGDLRMFTYTGSNIQFGAGKDGSTLTTSNSIMWLDGTNNSVNVGSGTNIASSILTLTSTTKGFLPPRMTTSQKTAIASPTAGLVVFDTTLNKLCVYTTTWETITSL
jgi:hypothetical protein